MLITKEIQKKIIVCWLTTGIVLIVLQILVGGITRITESGLSITEWKPIAGALPPLNNADWDILFFKYQSTDQFIHLKNEMNLREFKNIFFWEWIHRNWARLIGIVFLIPYVFFILKKWTSSEQTKKYLWLFVLGAMQGLMGWIMVRTGLKHGNLFVNHISLTIHFILALATLAMCLYFILEIIIPQPIKSNYFYHHKITFIFFCLIVLQLIYGAFMAGTHAATAAPTWPKINHEWIPSIAFKNNSWANVIFCNKIFIQLVHRCLAYTILIYSLWWYIKTKQINTLHFRLISKIILCLICTQIMLGIYTVLVSPNNDLIKIPAILHQLVGVLIFIVVFVNLYVLRIKKID